MPSPSGLSATRARLYRTSAMEDPTMLHAVHYPHELIAERVTFTPADHVLIARCRGAYNRLGFAYQLGFLRLTGRFPAQQPLEMLDDLLVYVAHAVESV